jgi:hypothetical protein
MVKLWNKNRESYYEIEKTEKKTMKREGLWRLFYNRKGKETLIHFIGPVHVWSTTMAQFSLVKSSEWEFSHNKMEIFTFATLWLTGTSYEMTKMLLSVTNICGLSHRCRRNAIFQNYTFFLHPWLKPRKSFWSFHRTYE